MKQRKTVRLYNLLFPIWLLVFIPSWLWLFLIPANFLLDMLAEYLSLRYQKAENRKEVIRKTILPVCLAGFAADFAGSLLLFSLYFIPLTAESEILYAAAYDPFSSPAAAALIFAAIGISGICIYLLDRRILKKSGLLNEAQVKCTALWLAVLTAPYTYLIPSKILY